MAEVQMRHTKSYTHEEQQNHVKACYDWTEQGNTSISYCKEHGIAKSTMEYWSRKYGIFMRPENHKPQKRLVQIPQKSVPKASDGPNCSLIVHAGSVSIELPVGNQDADLKRVLLALKEII